MGNCKTCQHAIFDILWGEYKCECRQSILYILLDKEECKDYLEKKDKELRIAKRNSERLEILEDE